MESLGNPSDRRLCKWTGLVLRAFPGHLPPTRNLAKSPYFRFRFKAYVHTLSDDLE
jgi:hypothetical protein